MKIGFTTRNDEKVFQGIDKNYTRFLHFIDSAKFHNKQIRNISERLNVNLLNDFDVVIVGSPESRFQTDELEALRSFIFNGGKVFIITKFGGDRLNNTNIKNLFDDISPNNDELISTTNYLTIHPPTQRLDLYFSNIGRDDAFSYTRPNVSIDVTYPFFSFKGYITYDGGCTFSVEDNESITAIYPSDSSFSYPNPPTKPMKKRDYERKKTKPGAVLVFKKYGQGMAIYWGSRWSFSDELFNKYDNSSLLRQLFSTLMDGKGYDDELKRRKNQSQRHRLLHGYPMSKGLRPFNGDFNDLFCRYEIRTSKDICVGIIPHPLCTPKIPRCGYCTFPYERYDSKKEKMSVESVINEIKSLKNRFHSQFLDRPVSSLYFGGGTANLTKPEYFRLLCETIANELNLKKDVEITLEGAPLYFIKNFELFSIMANTFPQANLRISVGVQTFDQSLLRKMGRDEMNGERYVERTIQVARDYGFNVSADLMFNLPGQTYHDIRRDLNRIVDSGVEHICWYNLVAYPGLNTPWGKNKDILRTIPRRNEGVSNWEMLYFDLLNAGYEPVTVTDFRKKNAKEKGRYRYEEDLRSPETKNWVGFGPCATSLLTNDRLSGGIKLLNPTKLKSYVLKLKQKELAWNGFFPYTPEDLKIYWLTRKIKGTSISKTDYQKLFENELNDDFGQSLDVLSNQGLLHETKKTYKLTPKGFYFADSIAGLFSWLRVSELSAKGKTGKVVKPHHTFEMPGNDFSKNWNDPRDMFMG